MIHWRPELNALTVPQSYSVRYVPDSVLGYDELAEEMARENPVWSKELIKSMLIARDKMVMRQLLNGRKVTLENAFSYYLSFSARLDAPDSPLPPVAKMLQVKISPSRMFLKEMRAQAQMERLPAEEKTPVILAAEDTISGLKDVLRSDSALRLNGNGLLFDQTKADEGCVITGTRSGRTAQSRFVKVANAEVMLLPDLPAQEDEWNNEYTLSLAARYTKNGSLRTTLYRRRLRSPLLIDGVSFETGPGILTDNADTPYVRVQACGTTASVLARIEATVDLNTDELFLRLLDMKEQGAPGDRVKVTTAEMYILPGASGSDLSSLTVVVDEPELLAEMVRTDYTGRVVDVLDIRVES
jgi:hypothetical protein